MGRAHFFRIATLIVVLAMTVGCAVRPVAFSTYELAQNADANISALTENQEIITQPIGLYEAMARALKYNLDLRVKQVQQELANVELDLSHYSLLPDTVVNSGYADRDNLYASRSLDLATGAVDPTSSSSQDKRQYSRDLTFSWNILDFGLSYIRANQAADRYLVAKELSRNTSHKLLEEVRSAYWRAQAYDRSMDRLRSIEKRANRAIADSKEISNARQISRTDSLIAERELVKVRKAIGLLQRDYQSSKIELAKLMNLRPGTRFALRAEKKTEFPSKFDLTPDEMMFLAARDRPEIREVMYLERINLQEAKAAMLEILPGLNLYAGSNWDSNSFLLNNSWNAWGATVSWSLLKLFQYPAKKYSVEVQQELFRQRALAMTMTVMTQVHLSRLRFDSARKEYGIARDYHSVQTRLVRQFRNEAKAARISEHELLMEEMNTLIADMKYDIAYAELQSAHAGVLASIGAEPISAVDHGMDLADLTNALRGGWSTAITLHQNSKTRTGKKNG